MDQEPPPPLLLPFFENATSDPITGFNYSFLNSEFGENTRRSILQEYPNYNARDLDTIVEDESKIMQLMENVPDYIEDINKGFAKEKIHAKRDEEDDEDVDCGKETRSTMQPEIIPEMQHEEDDVEPSESESDLYENESGA